MVLPYFRSWFRRRDGKAPATIRDAVKILGRRRVVTAKQVYKARKLKEKVTAPQINHAVNLTLEELQKAALENKKGKDIWRLVYCIGYSVMEELIIHGTDPIAGRPVFLPGIQNWVCTEVRKDSWYTTACESGYRLINFRLLFSDNHFDAQEVRIAKVCGEAYARLPENLLIEALFSLLLVTKERFLEASMHLGPSKDCYGDSVCVGYNFKNGLVLHTLNDRSIGYINDSIGVIVYLDSRKQMERAPSPPQT